VASANMSGDSRFRLETRLYQLSQNYGGNYSTCEAQLWLIKQGSSTKFANAPNYSSWSMSATAWGGGSGTFTYDFRSSSALLLAVADVNVVHDANGYASFYASADASVYSMGSAHVDDGIGLSRIPKAPKAPAALAIDAVTTTGFRVSVPAPDNMGAGIDQYEVVASTDGFATAAADVLTNPATFSGLTPGVTYSVRGRAHNSQGWGAWSPVATQQTQPALYMSDGAAWVPVALQASDGNAWSGAQLLYSDGAAWQNPLPQ
jgi:hypothetical protein